MGWGAKVTVLGERRDDWERGRCRDALGPGRSGTSSHKLSPHTDPGGVPTSLLSATLLAGVQVELPAVSGRAAGLHVHVPCRSAGSCMNVIAGQEYSVFVAILCCTVDCTERCCDASSPPSAARSPVWRQAGDRCLSCRGDARFFCCVPAASLSREVFKRSARCKKFFKHSNAVHSDQDRSQA